jgi:hypothetical protein
LSVCFFVWFVILFNFFTEFEFVFFISQSVSLCVCWLLKGLVVKSSHPQQLNTMQFFWLFSSKCSSYRRFWLPSTTYPPLLLFKSQMTIDVLSLSLLKGTSLTCHYWLLFHVSTSKHLKNIFVSRFNCLCVFV